MVCRVVGNKVILEKFSTEVIQKAFAELEDIAHSLELDRVRINTLILDVRSVKLGFEALVDVGIIVLANFGTVIKEYH